MRITFLLNWYLNPYHTPIIVAKEKGFYEQQGIELSIIEPTNPSDVTKIIGEGEINLGLKAMVHCYAARNRGYKIKSIGTLLDEPPTGLISLKRKNIKSIGDIKGKKLGYVGEFGKIMIDNLAVESGLEKHEYTMVRVGMDGARAVLSEKVDAAIGLSCFQQLEIESYGEESRLLRIDELANLGCCCFCSILFIANEKFIKNHPKKLAGFMQATMQGMQLTREIPKEAYRCLIKNKPGLDVPLYEKIFHHTLPFFSKDLLNVERDWLKVGAYAKNLGIMDDKTDSFECYSNQFIPNVAFTEGSFSIVE